MATRYGKSFRTRRGRYGRYKYVNGRRVSFVGARRKRNFRSNRKPRRNNYGFYHRRY